MSQPSASNTAPYRAITGWKSVARILFLIAALLAAGILLAKEWDGISAALENANLGLILAALLAAIINVVLTGLSWRALLNYAPVQLSLRQAAHVFFLGQIGKYLPGAVWSFLASAELAKQAGLPRKTAVSSLLLALAIGLGTGLVLAFVILPDAVNLIEFSWLWAALGLAALLVLAWPPVKSWLLKKAQIDFPIPAPALLISAAAALGGWLFAGIQIAFVAQAIGIETGDNFIILAAAIYAFAWIAGFLFFIAPAGLGAREGTLVALLATEMPIAEALVAALLSRLLMTVADFLLAGIGSVIGNEPSAE